MGAFSMAFSLSFAVAPWAGTTVYARFGATAVWTSVFMVGIAAAAIMLKVTSDRPERSVAGTSAKEAA